jgi:hypothetical protein
VCAINPRVEPRGRSGHYESVTRTMDDSTRASDPGGIRLSMAKLRRVDPGLFTMSGRVARVLSRDYFVVHVREHLQYGDSRAAVVVRTAPLWIAAYTDEFDSSVVLELPSTAGDGDGWSIGDRLLTINTYAAQGPHAADLVFGPRHIARWYNMAPYIADLLTDDIAAVNARKHRIAEAEWARAEVSAEDYLRHTGGRVRDGRPSRVLRSAI